MLYAVKLQFNVTKIFALSDFLIAKGLEWTKSCFHQSSALDPGESSRCSPRPLVGWRERTPSHPLDAFGVSFYVPTDHPVSNFCCMHRAAKFLRPALRGGVELLFHGTFIPRDQKLSLHGTFAPVECLLLRSDCSKIIPSMELRSCATFIATQQNFVWAVTTCVCLVRSIA